MHTDIIVYGTLGIAMLGMAIIPRKLKRHPFSLPTVYVALGVLLAILPTGIVQPSPEELPLHRGIIERFTEIIVIISLAGAGLSIDRKFCWDQWKTGWRLLLIAMPITITLVSLGSWWALGLAPASAILLGACLAPTDPVLAKDVQVEGPNEGEDHEVRFGLTLEASLNDGLAFPFVYFAIALASYGALGGWAWEWLLDDVLLKITVGLIIGGIVGRLLSKYFAGSKNRQAEAGVFVMGAIFLVYGLAEACHGYGFVAVFVAAFSGRQVNRDGEHHTITHRFIDQAEKILLAAALLGFGALLVNVISRGFLWTHLAAAAVILLIVRPLSAYLSLLSTDLKPREKFAVSFFGIRGLGSLYYLAFALGQTRFSAEGDLWSITSLTIVGSILIHGFSVSPMMRFIDGKKPLGS